MNKYKSRKDVPDKYKWDLTDFFKNDEEFDKLLNEVNEEIKKIKNFIGCTKNSKKLYKFLIFDINLNSKIDNLYAYAVLKNDEELGISIPCSYMHSANSIMYMDDVNECCKLLQVLLAST